MRTPHGVTQVMLLTLWIVPGCRSDTAEDLRNRPALLQTGQNESDALQAPLAARQRELIAALLTTDSAALGQLLDTGFQAHDTRAAEIAPLAIDAAVRAEQFTLFQILAGHFAARLDAEYPTILARREGDVATVYATGTSAALRTTWRRNGEVWQASQLIVVHPAAISRELAR